MQPIASDGNELLLEPVPSILIESLRDIGYSFSTALADVIDNSLSANADNIYIEARMEPSPAVAIIDDGRGLLRDELLDSMRMGSRDPKLSRDTTDLGRFGLGLKTASFSQCRRLTVVSRIDGITSGFIWDLDHVVYLNEWKIVEVAEFDTVPFFDLMPEHGTAVIWETLDRVFGEEDNPSKMDVVLNRHLTSAEDHLSLVYHRFIGREKGYKTVKMWMNGGRIRPLDPFVTNNSATIQGPVEPIAGGVTVQSFTLPHASKYRRRADYERNGLTGGYIKSQGIYLYRSRRLIIHGTWFGLAKKSTLTQLCRVKIDIDNTHDEDWKIDVKKASAQLPENVRTEIRNLVNRFKSPSIRVYKRRGTKQVSKELHPVWCSSTNGEELSFVINRSHPVLQGYVADLPEDAQRSFELVMRLIESGFPKDALFYELSKNSENVTVPALGKDDIARVAKEFFAQLKSKGLNEKHILDVMSSQEMFDRNWEQVLTALNIREG